MTNGSREMSEHELIPYSVCDGDGERWGLLIPRDSMELPSPQEFIERGVLLSDDVSLSDWPVWKP